MLLAVVGVLLALSGCASPEERSIQSMREASTFRCSDLTGDLRHTCEVAIKNYEKTYLAGLEKNLEKLAALEEEKKQWVQKGISAGKNCQTFDTNACKELQVLSQKLEKVQKDHAGAYAHQKQAGLNVSKSIRFIPQMLKETNPHANVLCKVRGTGVVECVNLASLISYYDPRMVGALLADLHQLHGVYGLDKEKDTLLKCGDGIWSKINFTGTDPNVPGPPSTPPSSAGSQRGFHLDENLSELTPGTVQRMNDECLRAILSTGAGGSGAPGQMDGFSGLSGIDPLQRGPGCGLEGLEDPGASALSQMVDIILAADHLCESDPVAEGEAISQPPPGEVNDVGEKEPDGTETAKKTVTTDKDGNTITTEEWEYPWPDGSCTVTKETKKNKDGKIIEESKTTICKKKNPDKDKTSTFDYKRQTTDAKTGEVTSVESYIKRDSNGNIVQSDFTVQRGAQTMKMKTRVINGREYIWIKDGDKPWKNHAGPKGGSQECTDEVCLACAKAQENFVEVANECLLTQGRSAVCIAYTKEASCCRDPRRFPVGPRLTIPDPQSDEFVCLAGESQAEKEAKTKACELQCRVSSGLEHEQFCVERCTAPKAKYLPFDAMDAYCTRAIDEKCITGKKNPVPLPQPHPDRPTQPTFPKPPRPPGPTPPLPTAFDAYKLFP